MRCGPQELRQPNLERAMRIPWPPAASAPTRGSQNDILSHREAGAQPLRPRSRRESPRPASTAASIAQREGSSDEPPRRMPRGLRSPHTLAYRTAKRALVLIKRRRGPGAPAKRDLSNPHALAYRTAPSATSEEERLAAAAHEPPRELRPHERALLGGPCHERAVLLRAPQQVRHHLADRPVRHVLVHPVAVCSQRQRHVVAHPPELPEAHARVLLQALLVHLLDHVLDRVLIVRRHHQHRGAPPLGRVRAVHALLPRGLVRDDVGCDGVVVLVRCLKIRLDRIGVPLLLSEPPLLHHVRPPHDLGAEHEAVELGAVHISAHALESVPQVALVRVQDYSAILVVLAHEPQGDLVDRGLHVALLSVDHEGHVAVGRVRGDAAEALEHGLELRDLVGLEGVEAVLVQRVHLSDEERRRVGLQRREGVDELGGVDAVVLVEVHALDQLVHLLRGQSDAHLLEPGPDLVLGQPPTPRGVELGKGDVHRGQHLGHAFQQLRLAKRRHLHGGEPQLAVLLGADGGIVDGVHHRLRVVLAHSLALVVIGASRHHLVVPVTPLRNVVLSRIVKDGSDAERLHLSQDRPQLLR
mmetsp:Transcript_11087/g.27186  ORF Transcript_11087/g.27186 Transcript_11087/m.27186 type:complete len:584 (-) Transcript_11087:578-2329(-)